MKTFPTVGHTSPIATLLCERRGPINGSSMNKCRGSVRDYQQGRGLKTRATRRGRIFVGYCRLCGIVVYGIVVYEPSSGMDDPPAAALVAKFLKWNL